MCWVHCLSFGIVKWWRISQWFQTWLRSGTWDTRIDLKFGSIENVFFSWLTQCFTCCLIDVNVFGLPRGITNRAEGFQVRESVFELRVGQLQRLFDIEQRNPHRVQAGVLETAAARAGSWEILVNIKLLQYLQRFLGNETQLFCEEESMHKHLKTTKLKAHDTDGTLILNLTQFRKI